MTTATGLLAALTTKPAATRTEYVPMKSLLPGVSEPAPLVQFETALDALKARMSPDEVASIRIAGLQNVTWMYTNKLTETEAVAARMKAMETALVRLEQLLPRDGTGLTLTAADVQALRAELQRV